MHQRWSTQLGRGDDARILIARSGRIIVSTTNPYRCCAVEPSGKSAWTASGINATREGPDDTLVANTHDARELLLLDRDGRTQHRWWLGARKAALVGWRGTTPVFSAVGGCWVDPFIYQLRDDHLYRYVETGELVEKVPVPIEPFRAALRELCKTEQAIDRYLRFSRHLALRCHPRRPCLIAFDTGPHGWLTRLRPDGALEWLTALSPGCCNSICFVGDEVIVHTSSCGRRVSFVAVDGVVFRSHELDVLWSVANDQGAVFAVGLDAVRAFDPDGEPAWKLDLPDITAAEVRGTTLYVVTRASQSLVLTALTLNE
jgi:hypothetical protein